MDMTIQEIADELNTSKQNVNQILKRGMKKLYWGVKEKLGSTVSSFEVVILLARFFNVTKEKDFQHFFFDFPEDVRRDVILSVKDKILIKDFNLEELLKKNFNNKRNN